MTLAIPSNQQYPVPGDDGKIVDTPTIPSPKEGQEILPDVPWQPFAGPSGENLNIPTLPDKQEYRQLVFSSVAYEWLVSCLEREICLCRVREPVETGTENVKTVTSYILTVLLDDNEIISRGAWSKTYKTEFQVVWRLKQFLSTRYGVSENLGQVLRRAIALTGSGCEAQALTCSEYLDQTWPMSGKQVLAAVSEALETGRRAEGKPDFNPLLPLPPTRAAELPDGLLLSATFDGAYFHLTATGTADSIAEVGEIVAWLTAAFGSSDSFDSDKESTDRSDEVTLCSPFMREDSWLKSFWRLAGASLGSGSSHRPGGKPGVPARYHSAHLEAETNIYHFQIDFSMSKPRKKIGVPGQCWHRMFTGAVTVNNFPIPRRPRSGTGLEISLPMVATLMSSARLYDFMGRFYLKGFSSMLVPVDFVGGVVFWHLSCNLEGYRISFLEAESVLGNSDLSAEALKTARHVVGWCSEALCMAGKPGPGPGRRELGLVSACSLT